MDGERDIVMLAVPFAAGVAAGALLVQMLPPTSPASWLLPATALPAAVASIFPAARKERCRAAFSLTFLMLGIFCLSSYSLLPANGDGGWRLAKDACEALKGRILALPFRDPRSPGMVLALLTGDKSSLSRQTVTTFRDSGAAHILALSGLHLGIIYSIIRRAFAFAGNSPRARGFRCAATITATLFYTIMTGAGPSIVRAFLFISISEISAISPGRRRSPLRVLAASLTVQLALKPDVIGSAGFQLSYLAVLGIVTVFPVLQGFFPGHGSILGRISPMKRIWDAAALSISCQLFTAPLAWYRFHSFPRYFLLTNILALPLSTATMALSVAAIALSAAGICPEVLVQAVEWCAGTLLSVLETVSSMG